MYSFCILNFRFNILSSRVGRNGIYPWTVCVCMVYYNELHISKPKRARVCACVCLCLFDVRMSDGVLNVFMIVSGWVSFPVFSWGIAGRIPNSGRISFVVA